MDKNKRSTVMVDWVLAFSGIGGHLSFPVLVYWSPGICCNWFFPLQGVIQTMWKTLALLFFFFAHEGLGAQIFRVSSNPVRAFQGSDALFQWTLESRLTSRPDFQGMVFGVWRNGFVASYILSVTSKGGVFPNPDLKHEVPSLEGRVQWKGDLSQSVAAFQISHIIAEDQMDYGLRLEFGALKEPESDFLSLRVEGKSDDSAITASPSSPLSVTPGGNMSFQCEFHVGDKDKVVYDGITVGIWERGGILLTLLTLAKNETLIMNPKLDQEVPAYHGRVFAKTWSNRTTNTSVMTIEINNIRESDRTCYGCGMYFGPFQELLGAAVRLDIQVPNRQYATRTVENSVRARVGEYARLQCPVFSLDIEFQDVYWSYCTTENCNIKEPKWSWIAGMNSKRVTKVNGTGPYANRANMSLNGTLGISKVKAGDQTIYKCTVNEGDFTSPLVYFVTLDVDSRVRPEITSRSQSEVTALEGHVLYLKCETTGIPPPIVTWRRNGHVIQNRTTQTNYIRENVTTAAEGVYECEASNSIGTDNYMVVVKIKTAEGPTPKPSKGALGAGAIAGIVVGVVGFVVILVVIAYCYVRHFCQRTSRREPDGVASEKESMANGNHTEA